MLETSHAATGSTANQPAASKEANATMNAKIRILLMPFLLDKIDKASDEGASLGFVFLEGD